MSWLSSVFHKKDSVQKDKNIQTENQIEKKEDLIYISIDHLSLKVFGITYFENSKVKKINWFEEIHFYKYENLKEGERVKNFFIHLTPAINDLSHRLEGSQKVFVSIPLEGTFFSNIIIPKTEKSLQVLASEMKKKVPIPFSEIMFAQNKVFEMNNLESYFCIAMQKQIFDDYIQVFKNFGINPYIELGIFSLSRLFPKRSLTYEYKLLIYISHYRTQLVFCRNNFVMEIIIIENGVSEIEDSLINKSGVDRITVQKIIRNKDLLKDTNLESFKIINDIQSQYMQKLSQDIFAKILNFENRFDKHIQYIYINSILNDSILEDNLKILSEDKINIETISKKDLMKDFEMDNDLKKDINNSYTHIFGLAKKDI